MTESETKDQSHWYISTQVDNPTNGWKIRSYFRNLHSCAFKTLYFVRNPTRTRTCLQRLHYNFTNIFINNDLFKNKFTFLKKCVAFPVSDTNSELPKNGENVARGLKARFSKYFGIPNFLAE